MLLHLNFHHFFDGSAEKVFQRFLNILHSKLIQSAQPELSALMFAYSKRQRFLTPVSCKSKNYISGFLTITPLSPTEIVNGIDENDRINIINRPILLFFNLRKYLICDIGK